MSPGVTFLGLSFYSLSMAVRLSEPFILALSLVYCNTIPVSYFQWAVYAGQQSTERDEYEHDSNNKIWTLTKKCWRCNMRNMLHKTDFPILEDPPTRLSQRSPCNRKYRPLSLANNVYLEHPALSTSWAPCMRLHSCRVVLIVAHWEDLLPSYTSTWNFGRFWSRNVGYFNQNDGK